MRNRYVLTVLCGLCLSIVMAGMLDADSAHAAMQSSDAKQASDLLFLPERISRDVREALLGRESAFKSLQKSRDQFDEVLGALKRSSEDQSSPVLLRALHELHFMWVGLHTHVDNVLSHKKELLRMREGVDEINHKSPRVVTLTDEIAELSESAGVKHDFLYLLMRGGMMSQRITKNANILMQGDGGDGKAAVELYRDAKVLVEIQDRLRMNAPKMLIPKLDELGVVVRDIFKVAQDVLADPEGLQLAKVAGRIVLEQSEPLFGKVHHLVDALYVEQVCPNKSLHLTRGADAPPAGELSR
jgi:twitching motility protein PilJ